MTGTSSSGYDSDVTDGWDTEPKWDEDSLLPEAEEDWAPYGKSSSLCLGKLQQSSDVKSVDSLTVTSSSSDFSYEASTKIQPVQHSSHSVRSHRSSLGRFLSDRENNGFASSITVEPVMSSRSERSSRTLGNFFENPTRIRASMSSSSERNYRTVGRSCRSLSKDQPAKVRCIMSPKSKRQSLGKYLNDSVRDKDPFTVHKKNRHRRTPHFTSDCSSNKENANTKRLFPPSNVHAFWSTSPELEFEAIVSNAEGKTTFFNLFEQPGKTVSFDENSKTRCADESQSAGNAWSEATGSFFQNPFIQFRDSKEVKRGKPLDTSYAAGDQLSKKKQGFFPISSTDMAVQEIPELKSESMEHWDFFGNNSADSFDVESTLQEATVVDDKAKEPIWNDESKGTGSNIAYDVSPILSDNSVGPLCIPLGRPDVLPASTRCSSKQQNLAQSSREEDNCLSWTSDPSSNFGDCVLILLTGWSEADLVETYHVHKSVVGLGPRRSNALLRKFQAKGNNAREFLSGSASSPILEVDSQSAVLFPDVLDYMYSFQASTLNITLGNVGAFHKWAHYLGIPSLVEEVEQFIVDNLEKTNKQDFVKSAKEYRNEELMVRVLGRTPELSTNHHDMEDDHISEFLSQRLSL